MTLRVRARCCLEGAGTDSRPAILVARVCMFVCVGAYRVVSWSRAHALIDFLFFFSSGKELYPKAEANRCFHAPCYFLYSITVIITSLITATNFPTTTTQSLLHDEYHKYSHDHHLLASSLHFHPGRHYHCPSANATCAPAFVMTTSPVSSSFITVTPPPSPYTPSFATVLYLVED